MKKLRYYIVASVLAVIPLVSSCDQGLNDLEERVDGIEARIQSLREEIDALNQGIEALQAVSSGQTVSSWSETAGAYTIVFSDGTEIAFAKGSIGVGSAPAFKIDDEGYWTVNYGDGYSRLTGTDGKPVYAIGLNGVVPVFGVDDSGYWTVCYDGATFIRVTDAGGAPVLAVNSGEGADIFFESVYESDGYLVFKLKDGKEYRSPIVPDFWFRIDVPDDYQFFDWTDTKAYNISMNNVVQTTIFAPEGWKASIEDGTLTVTAPEEPTKAASTIIAESSADIAVLAVSAGGYCCIARVRVQLKSNAIPVAGAVLESVGFDNAVFNLNLQNVRGYYYDVLLPEDDDPLAESLISSGKQGVSESLVVDGLSSRTAYKLVLLPVNGEIKGTVIVVPFRTTGISYEDNLAAYNAGKVIEIAGVKYSKDVNGEAVLVTASSAEDDFLKSVSRDGVYFLETEGDNAFLLSGDTLRYNVAIVGRYSARQAKVVCGSKGLGISGVSFAAFNICFDASVASQHLVLVDKGSDVAPERFHIEGCNLLITKNKNICSIGMARSPKSIRFVYNKVSLNLTDSRTTFFNYSGCKYMSDIEEITVENNVFCSLSPTKSVSFSASNGGTTTNGGPVVKLTNNTLYNVTANYSFLYLDTAQSVTVTKNLIVNPNATANGSLVRITRAGATADVSDNILYQPSGGVYDYHGNCAVGGSTRKAISKLSESPLASYDTDTMVFTPVPEYSAYGAQ